MIWWTEKLKHSLAREDIAPPTEPETQTTETLLMLI